MGKNRIAGLAVGALALASCGGGGNLADEAESHADAQCACTDFDCTLEHTQWFNKISITQKDDLDALSESDRARYDAANSRSADCQNELR